MTGTRPGAPNRATYVLIHGAAADSWCWHLLADELRGRGHDVVAVDLPCADESAGLSEYADKVIQAIGDRSDVVVVAHSFGGFTAPLVCDRASVSLLVMLQAMIPLPGEAPGDWWAATGHDQARREQDTRDGGAEDDLVALFVHDLPSKLAAEALSRQKAQASTPFTEPWPLPAWPDVPTRFLLSRGDRFFPADFMRRVVRERLHLTPDEMPGDHLPMLGHPTELADRLEAYWSQQRPPSEPPPH
ncbi:alpha/beta hydrolase [Micromonospora sp. DR5-3]|uniref:alpha/beta fold hydrolase n=1 Tax=unclassified Micromonospora TaxID=2617518 RepID=UPI0011D321BC|nr:MULTISPECIES: alpha/beta hydrolase [unclassified Micromonospora]MCW3819446.1 alpha/beta hydrolase [Micromonospora sp. DR5-3]TYC20770.1 alpha/beta hydrolase [Micromonospora sp. MP36]